MGSTTDIEGSQPSALDWADIMKQLTVGISRQNEVISESNVLVREEFGRNQEKDEEKKNRFSKLHSSFHNMLLMASSTYGDRAATPVSPSCLYFFKQEAAGLADQQMLVLFREMRLPDVGFVHGVVQAFLSGQFLYFEPGCPNNFSIFCFYEKL